jgi:murein L,D-transpeptidase YcbB/YkuD
MPRPYRRPAVAALATLLTLGCLAGCERRPPEVGFEEGTAAYLRLASSPDRPLTLPVSRNAGAALIRARGEAQAAARELYKRRDYRTAWIGGGGELPVAGALVAALAAADRDGLDPRAYGTAALGREVDELAAMERGDARFIERAAIVDLRLTEAFLTYAEQLAEGRVTPGEAGVRWHTRSRSIDLAALAEAVHEHGVDGVVAALRPRHPQYEALRAARDRYLALTAMGGWSPLPEPAADEPVAERGARGPMVAALARRLEAEGDLRRGPASDGGEAGDASRTGAVAVFDAAVEAALVRFQQRHGLEPDGKLGPATRAALDVPAAERLRQIELNMERWRWMPADLGDRYLLVDIPAFELRGFYRGRQTLDMRVVVGKPRSPTPVFSDAMRYVVFNPRWNVPASIARHEILPATRRDPGYLASQNMELVRVGDGGTVVASGGSEVEAALAAMHAGEGGWRVRQRAGGGNSLGRVKFMFPNRFNVYLHDTPADHLFARAVRDFSHGCVRVERPEELAAWVLRGDPDWSPERFARAIGSGRTSSVNLPEPLPVHLVYWTAWVDPDGRVRFRDDVYAVDEALEAALDEERATLSPAPAGDPRTVASAAAPPAAPAGRAAPAENPQPS